jgi:hypothetical protein
MPEAITVTVTAEERQQLEAISRSRSLPHGLVRREKINMQPHVLYLEEINRSAITGAIVMYNRRAGLRENWR